MANSLYVLFWGQGKMAGALHDTESLRHHLERVRGMQTRSQTKTIERTSLVLKHAPAADAKARVDHAACERRFPSAFAPDEAVAQGLAFRILYWVMSQMMKFYDFRIQGKLDLFPPSLTDGPQVWRNSTAMNRTCSSGIIPNTIWIY